MQRLKAQKSPPKAVPHEQWIDGWGFDLSRYEAFGSLTIGQWMDQLAERQYSRSTYFEQTSQGETLGRVQADARKRLMRRFASPVAELGPEYVPQLGEFDGISVTLLTMLGIQNLARDAKLIETTEEREPRLNPFLPSDHDPFDIRFWNSRVRKEDKWPEAHFVVDLTAPQEQLVDEFAKSVSLIRAEAMKRLGPKLTRKPRVPPVYKSGLLNERDFQPWVTYRVMPFLDLTFAAEVDGRKIKEGDMADTLFPGDSSAIEKYKKSTLWYVKQLLDKTTYSTLLSQSMYTAIRQAKSSR